MEVAGLEPCKNDEGEDPRASPVPGPCCCFLIEGELVEPIENRVRVVFTPLNGKLWDVVSHGVTQPTW